MIAVREMTTREDRFERIIACCFSEADAAFYWRLLPAAHLGPRPDRDDHKGRDQPGRRQRKRDRRDPAFSLLRLSSLANRGPHG